MENELSISKGQKIALILWMLILQGVGLLSIPVLYLALLFGDIHSRKYTLIQFGFVVNPLLLFGLTFASWMLFANKQYKSTLIVTIIILMWEVFVWSIGFV